MSLRERVNVAHDTWPGTNTVRHDNGDKNGSQLIEEGRVERASAPDDKAVSRAMRKGFPRWPSRPRWPRRRWLPGALLLAAPVLIALGIADSRKSGDEIVQPDVGLPGKDVIWLPTPDQMVMEMLTITDVGPDDLVYDLGAGDGKIVIAAAEQFGASGVGIEYNPDLAALAQRNARRAGVDDRVRIIQGDIFQEDFSSATVVTMYLLSDLNLRLKPTLLAMEPGTRVVSHSFNLGAWTADAEIRTPDARGYFWVVPARVEGRWSGRRDGESREDLVMDLVQRYQTVEGTITLAGHSAEIEAGLLRGKALSFRFIDARGRSTTAAAVVEAGTVQGVLSTEEGVAGFLASQQR